MPPPVKIPAPISAPTFLQPVRPTSFHKYFVTVKALNWPVPPNKTQSFLAYAERRIKALIDHLGKVDRPYHEQCEKARDLLQDMLSRFQSDSRGALRLAVQLKIEGSFGKKPRFHAVHVVYEIT